MIGQAEVHLSVIAGDNARSLPIPENTNTLPNTAVIIFRDNIQVDSSDDTSLPFVEKKTLVPRRRSDQCETVCSSNSSIATSNKLVVTVTQTMCCSQVTPTVSSVTTLSTRRSATLSTPLATPLSSNSLESFISAIFNNVSFRVANSTSVDSFSISLVEESTPISISTTSASFLPPPTAPATLVTSLVNPAKTAAIPTPSSNSMAEDLSSNSPRTRAVIGSVVGGAMLVLVAGIFAWIFFQRRRRKEERTLALFTQASALLQRPHTRSSSFGTPPAWNRSGSPSWSSQIAVGPYARASSRSSDPFADDRGFFRRVDPQAHALTSPHDSFYDGEATKLVDPFADPSTRQPFGTYASCNSYGPSRNPILPLQPTVRRNPEMRHVKDLSLSNSSLSQYSSDSHENSRLPYAR